MYESGYYPAGAEHDPNAPWNQSDPEPVSQDIEYSCTMRRTATVETTNYCLVHGKKTRTALAIVTVMISPIPIGCPTSKIPIVHRKNSLTCSKKQPKNLPMARCLTSQNRFGKT